MKSECAWDYCKSLGIVTNNALRKSSNFGCSRPNSLAMLKLSLPFETATMTAYSSSSLCYRKHRLFFVLFLFGYVIVLAVNVVHPH